MIRISELLCDMEDGDTRLIFYEQTRIQASAILPHVMRVRGFERPFKQPI